MTNNSETLTTLLGQLKTDVINSMQASGKYATGQTANAITLITDGDSAQLQLPGYLQALETGRGPTSKNATPGNPHHDTADTAMVRGKRVTRQSSLGHQKIDR